LTWSKTLDQNLLVNPSDAIPTKMYSPSDTPVNFSLIGSYRLPVGPGQRFGWKSGPLGKVLEGWQLHAIYYYATGQPFTLTTPAVLVAGQNPELLSGQQSYLQWFNPNAFAPLPSFTLRNLPFYLDSMRQPPNNNCDAALIKDTRIREDLRVRFRFEAGNAFNHTRWGPPTWNPGGSGNGVVTYENKFPRLVTLSLEIIF